MKIDDMTFFHEGTMRICGSLDIEEVLQDCLGFLQKFMPTNIIQLAVYEEEQKGIRVVGSASDITFKEIDSLIPLSRDAITVMEEDKDKIIKLDNSFDYPIGRDVCIALGIKNVSSIGLHLQVKDVGMGVVSLFSQHPNLFTDEQARLLGLLHDPFTIAMSNALQYQEVLRLQSLLKDDNQYLNRELHHISGDEIIGEHFGLRNVMEQARQVTALNNQVLLLGETGVGKEVIANAIHYSSPRQSGPLIKVNCGAIPESLLDSELFGHEKGAFTGARERKRGRFERAHGGTLFLDEVGELPPAAQVRLLRVLETHEFERVGGSNPISVDVRVIAATNRNLLEMVKSNEFREDLWFRLNVFPIIIPPLRQRKADIPALVNYFIERKVREMNLNHSPVTAPGEIERLQQYDWPGNVRELENTVERELIRHQARASNSPLRFDVFENPSIASLRPDVLISGDKDNPVPLMTLDDVIRMHIIQVMEKTCGKIQGKDGAAVILGLHPSTLRCRMRKLNIPFGRQKV
jgi:transcriptional regulator with GAF, ATPase, and Fis domain